jgi:hypothetical protein
MARTPDSSKAIRCRLLGAVVTEHRVCDSQGLLDFLSGRHSGAPGKVGMFVLNDADFLQTRYHVNSV